jgi:hypothetical protein
MLRTRKMQRTSGPTDRPTARPTNRPTDRPTTEWLLYTPPNFVFGGIKNHFKSLKKKSTLKPYSEMPSEHKKYKYWQKIIQARISWSKKTFRIKTYLIYWVRASRHINVGQLIRHHYYFSRFFQMVQLSLKTFQCLVRGIKSFLINL